MQPHPALSEWQVEQWYAEAARRAAPQHLSTELPLLDRLAGATRTLRSAITRRAARRTAARAARPCPHTTA